MFGFTRDPGIDGVGVVFTDAVHPDGGVLDVGGAHGAATAGSGLDLVAATLGIPLFPLRQVHGVEVVTVNAHSDPVRVGATQADALITDASGLGLVIRAADCLPVLLADAEAGVVAAAHAGRVGLAGGVLATTVRAMQQRGAHRITAWIGPHICGRCYEVPAGMRAEVSALVPKTWATTSWGTPALDLGAGARAVLTDLGCHVNELGGCTYTDPDLHSYRRDGVRAGRQAGIVWLGS